MQTAVESDAEALLSGNGSGGVSANGSGGSNGSGGETSGTAAEQNWQWDESSDSLKVIDKTLSWIALCQSWAK